MKRIFVILTVATFFCTPALAAPRNATKAELAVIKKAFVDQIKDPYSIMLTNVQIQDDGTVCGQVNAKNSFGAYVGNVRFVGIYFAKDKRGKPVAIINHIDDGDYVYADQVCAEHGM